MSDARDESWTVTSPLIHSIVEVVFTNEDDR